jgi:hypothetical protein
MPKYQQYRQPWWTKDRVIEGLRRFYRDFGFAPTSTEVYLEHTTGTGAGRQGVGNPYPSSYPVLKYFSSFREAWTAAGVKVNRDWESWTAEEDWFISEGAGVYTRNELAEILDRTPNAVHRRLYDLGINSRSARGWTFHRAMRVTGIPDYVFRRYADRGELPYFRGTKCIYVDPADLLVVQEIDWANAPAELAAAVRKSLMSRLVKTLAGKDWRAGRPYQVHRTCTTTKYHKRRERVITPKPIEIDQGDLVKVSKDPELRNRIGLVHVVYWSEYGRQSDKRRAEGKGSCWVARVEFKGSKTARRRNCILPLEQLRRVEG